MSAFLSPVRETLFHALVESAPDAVVVMQARDGRIVLVNQQTEVVFGYSRADLIDRPVELLMPERFRAGHVQQRSAYAAYPRTRPMGPGLDLWGLRSNGSEFPVEVCLSSVETEDGPLIISIIRDVTMHRRLEAELRESERRFRQALEESGVLVFEQDRQLRYGSVCNPRPGVDGSVMVGRTDADLLPPEDAPPVTALKRGVLERGVGSRADVRTTIGDLPLFYDLRVEPLRDLAGEIAGVISIAVDITARKRVEEERQRLLAREQAARAEAEEALRVRDQFLAAITHDLGQPLVAIHAAAGLGRQALGQAGGAGLTAAGDYLQMIETAALDLQAMTSELVDLARLQSGRELDLVCHPTDLVALVRDEVAARQRAAPYHQIRLETAAEELIADVDRPRLVRVIGNLLGNAVKYSPEGGTIVATVGRDEAASRSWAVLTIEDEGLGIPAADLPHIFELFHRGSNVSGQIHGTGIGLAGARRIVEQHGGTIALTSTEGKGSTVTVRLPVS